MKKTVIFSTVLVLAFAFNGCNGGKSGNSNSSNSNVSANTTIPDGNNTNVTNPSGNTTNPDDNVTTPDGNNTNTTNPDSNVTTPDGNNTNVTTSHPYSYGYSCEAGEVVNSYTLPHCPDPKTHDSTLLGIDSNNNGVRDDVERWLIVRYKDNHKIVTEIGFQGARAHQFMFANPDKPFESEKIIDYAIACNAYFRNDASAYSEPIIVNHTIITSTAYKTIQFNTEARIRAYLAYDKALSGGVYEIIKHSKDRRAACTFDVDKMLGE
jgi:hypothetical protein